MLEKIIFIEVIKVNDVLVFGFLYNILKCNVMVNKILELKFESNFMWNYMFFIGFGDVDDNEFLLYVLKVINVNNLIVILSKIDGLLFVIDLFGYLNIRIYVEYFVDLIINKYFYGDFFMYILGYDSENLYIEWLEIYIYVFWLLCVYGICFLKFNDFLFCDDVFRVILFDLFKCLCFLGYIGEWCENEIDECL